MVDEPRHHQPPRQRKATARTMLLLALFVIAAMVWLMVGQAVMRGAPSPGARIGSSL